MTTEAREVIAAYEALGTAERQQVAIEIMRRATATNDMNAEAFEEVAAEVFRGYDVEESNDRDE